MRKEIKLQRYQYADDIAKAIRSNVKVDMMVFFFWSNKVPSNKTWFNNNRNSGAGNIVTKFEKETPTLEELQNVGKEIRDIYGFENIVISGWQRIRKTEESVE